MDKMYFSSCSHDIAPTEKSAFLLFEVLAWYRTHLIKCLIKVSEIGDKRYFASLSTRNIPTEIFIDLFYSN